MAVQLPWSLTSPTNPGGEKGGAHSRSEVVTGHTCIRSGKIVAVVAIVTAVTIVTSVTTAAVFVILVASMR